MARTYATEEHVMSAVTSRNNIRDVASGVLCRSTPRLYDSNDQVQLASECIAAEYIGVIFSGVESS
jgi:hypothetical protein